MYSSASYRTRALDPKLCLLAHAVPGLMCLYTLAGAMDVSSTALYALCAVSAAIFVRCFRCEWCRDHFAALSRRSHPLGCLLLEAAIGGLVGRELMFLLLNLCRYNGRGTQLLCIPVLLVLPGASLILGACCLWNGFLDSEYGRAVRDRRLRDDRGDALREALVRCSNSLGALAVLLIVNTALRLWGREANDCAWAAAFTLVCMIPFTSRYLAAFCPSALARNLLQRLDTRAEPCARKAALTLAAVLAALCAWQTLFPAKLLLRRDMWGYVFPLAAQNLILAVGLIRCPLLILITLLFGGKRR